MSSGGSRHGRRLRTVVCVERKKKKKKWMMAIGKSLFFGFIDTLTMEESCINYYSAYLRRSFQLLPWTNKFSYTYLDFLAVYHVIHYDSVLVGLLWIVSLFTFNVGFTGLGHVLIQRKYSKSN